MICEYSHKNIRFNSLQFASIRFKIFASKYSLQNIRFETKQTLKQNIRFNLLQFASKYLLQNIPFHSSVPLSLFMSVSLSVSMSCVGMDMQHGCRQTALACTFSIVLNMRHGLGQLDIQNVDMQHGHGDAAGTWRCSMGMVMQYKHGDAAWTWICSVDMDMDMQYEHGHAVWTWTCSMNMDMQHEHGAGQLDMQHVHGL